jgi:hypothetical protein
LFSLHYKRAPQQTYLLKPKTDFPSVPGQRADSQANSEMSYFDDKSSTEINDSFKESAQFQAEKRTIAWA